MANELVYVASPFSHPDHMVQHNRFLDVNWWIREQTDKYRTNVYYSPIKYYYELVRSLGLRGDAEFWKIHDKIMMDKADRMIVLQLDGWDTSVGVKIEIEYMKSIGKPIKYIKPEG